MSSTFSLGFLLSDGWLDSDVVEDCWVAFGGDDGDSGDGDGGSGDGDGGSGSGDGDGGGDGRVDESSF